MKLADLKLTYVASVVVIGLIILSPTLALIIALPPGERFSEFYLLGSNHLVENYLFNVSQGMQYRVYVGVRNHMDTLEYYRVAGKFRNQTESLPNSTSGTPSSLAEVSSYEVFVVDEGSVETEITFSLGGVSLQGNSCRVARILLNDEEVGTNKTALWDPVNSGFYYELFFELWVYDAGSSQFRYDNEFVTLWLNVTSGL